MRVLLPGIHRAAHHDEGVIALEAGYQFTLVELDGVPAEGIPFSVEAVGDLTIHGVTRRVAIDLQGQLTNGLVVIVGSLEIQFADYDIDTPASGLVLSVEDHGIMELQLVFERA